jgi:hypothetical protein
MRIKKLTLRKLKDDNLDEEDFDTLEDYEEYLESEEEFEIDVNELEYQTDVDSDREMGDHISYYAYGSTLEGDDFTIFFTEYPIGALNYGPEIYDGSFEIINYEIDQDLF